MLENMEIDLTCPGCGHQIKKSLGWLDSNSKLTCVCGADITLKKDESFRKFTREVEGLDREIKKLNQTIRLDLL